VIPCLSILILRKNFQKKQIFTLKNNIKCPGYVNDHRCETVSFGQNLSGTPNVKGCRGARTNYGGQSA
jgi:hypothetical protein